MNVALRSLGMLSVLVTLARPVGAAPLDDAIATFESGNFPVALSRLKPLADKGDATAQFYLAILYQNGSGVTRELAEAHRLYRQAAEQGHAQAQFNLGVLHHKGEGVARDDAEARRLYRLAAEQGHARAQFETAQLYFSGQGGDADLVQAHLWFALAAATFPDTPGSDWRYKAQVQRNLVASRMSPEQRSEARQLAQAWVPPAPARPASLPAAGGRGRAPQAPDRIGTGSGFFVSEAGHVVTNAHVVPNCTTIRVIAPDFAEAAELVASDVRLDLAILKAARTAPAVASIRPAVRQGEAIAAYGFPLPGALASSGNFTTGGVTALAGLQDNASRLQISAPVQPGNSGGPLLDESGNVVGVVVSKIDALRVVRLTADIPQNVNFAVKASEAATFLDAHKVPYAKGKLDARLSPSDLADRARTFSVRIECRRPGVVTR